MTRLQITWCVLEGLTLLAGVLFHGKKRDDFDLRVTVVALVISAGLWYWAGLWDKCF